MTSVASRNLFDLLDDEVEDFDVPNEGKQETTETPVVQKKVDRSRASRTEARIRHEYPMRGGFKNAAPNKNEEARTAPRDRNVGPRLSGRRDEGGGGGIGGDFPSRNSRGARTGERARSAPRGARRGREFDRHSASGKYDSEKKETQAWGDPTWQGNNNEGSGEATTWENNETNKGTDLTAGEVETTPPSNWNNGTETQTGAGWNSTEQPSESSKWEENAANAEGQANSGAGNWNEEDTANKPEWDSGLQVEDTSAAQSAPPPVLEEVVKTLDEYLAEKAQKSLDISLPEVRKPNEGVDDSQWKDAVQLQKEDDEDFLFTGKEQSMKLKSKKSKMTKNVLEIDQTFGERPGGGYQRGRGRGRRGRGGREGGADNFRERRDYDRRDSRGGGGRGVVNLDDATAFPTLGSA